jgi:hypothetical protein
MPNPVTNPTPVPRPNPVSNKLKGKIVTIVDVPPYRIATIELDRTVAQHLTIAYIPIPGGPVLDVTSHPAKPSAAAQPADQASGGTDPSCVTVNAPVIVTPEPDPDAYLSSGT